MSEYSNNFVRILDIRMRILQFGKRIYSSIRGFGGGYSDIQMFECSSPKLQLLQISVLVGLSSQSLTELALILIIKPPPQT